MMMMMRSRDTFPPSIVYKNNILNFCYLFSLESGNIKIVTDRSTSGALFLLPCFTYSPNEMSRHIAHEKRLRSRSDSDSDSDSSVLSSDTDFQSRPRSKNWLRFGIIILILTSFMVSYHYNGCQGISKYFENPHANPDYYQELGDKVGFNDFDSMVETANLEQEYFKRDTSSSSSASSSLPPTPFYNMAGIRFVFVLAGFVVLNMFAIMIHHVYQRLAGLNRNYKNIDQVISPF